MQDFWSAHDEKVGKKDGKAVAPVLDEACPWLSAALIGKWDAEHGQYVGVPFKLSIKMEGQSVLVCLWAGENFDRWFCTFHGLDSLIERIEQSLRDGKGDWRPPKPYKRP